MSVLVLQNAQLIDPEAGTVSPMNMRIENGRITALSPTPLTVPPGAVIRDCQGKYLAPGIVDIGVKVCEPGERHKGSFKSAGLAAAICKK